MDEGYVLVIGSACVDVKGRPSGERSTFGQVRNGVGGVARNIAENLARLEVPTILLTALGDDVEGQRVRDQCEASGIDCSHVRIVEGGRTSTLMALLKPDGELDTTLMDIEIMEWVDSDYLRGHERLIAEADMVVIDATLPESTLETLFELTDMHNVRVCADPTSPALAGRLCRYISSMHLIVPNAAETQVLCGLAEAASDRQTAIDVARQLVSQGAYIAVVTMGEKGLAYADGSGAGYIPAIHTHVTDPTGAGDAFTGAVIFGLLNDVPVDEAMRLGVTAASLTLQTYATVIPDLSQEMLYDELVI